MEEKKEKIKQIIGEELNLEEKGVKLYSKVLKECKGNKGCTSELKDLLAALISDAKRHQEVLKGISKKF